MKIEARAEFAGGEAIQGTEAGGFGGIAKQRVGVFAGAQCAVGFVAAVGEGFRTNASQDSADVVFNALEHEQVWRCQQFLLLKQ